MKRMLVLLFLISSSVLFCSEEYEKYMILSKEEISNSLLQYDETCNVRLRYPDIACYANALLFPIKNLTPIVLQNDGKTRWIHLLGETSKKRIQIVDPDITNVFVVRAKTIEQSPKIIELYIGQDEEGGECYDPVDPLPNVYESIPLLRVENAVIEEVYEGNAALIDEMGK